MAFVFNGINNWEELVRGVNELKNKDNIDEREFRINEFFLDMNPMDSPEAFKDRPIVLFNGRNDDIIDPAGQESFAKEVEKVYEDKELLSFKLFDMTYHQITTQMLEEAIKFSKEVGKF